MDSYSFVREVSIHLFICQHSDQTQNQRLIYLQLKDV